MGSGDGAAVKPKGSGLGSFLGITLVLLLIFLVFGFFAARTDGGRQFVEEQLKKRTGCEFSITKSRITWPYDLVLEGVSAHEPDDSHAVLEISEAQIGLRLGTPWCLRLKGLNMVLEEGADGQWAPEIASELGPLESIEEVAKIEDLFQGDMKMEIEIENGRIEWLNQHGTRKAYAGNVSFFARPLQLPDRAFHYCRLMARKVLRSNGAELQHVEREWLSSEKQPYVEIAFAVDAGAKLDAEAKLDSGADKAKKRRVKTEIRNED